MDNEKDKRVEDDDNSDNKEDKGVRDDDDREDEDDDWEKVMMRARMILMVE